MTDMQKLEGHICKTFTLVKMFLKMFISVQKMCKVKTTKWKNFPSGNTVDLYDLCACVMMAAGINIISYSGGKGHGNVRVTSHQRPLCDWRTSVGGVALNTGDMHICNYSILYCHLVIFEYVNIILCLMHKILLCEPKYS